MTFDEGIIDRRKLLAEIAGIEADVSAIERQHGRNADCDKVRARLAVARADVSEQLTVLLADTKTTH